MKDENRSRLAFISSHLASSRPPLHHLLFFFFSARLPGLFPAVLSRFTLASLHLLCFPPLLTSLLSVCLLLACGASSCSRLVQTPSPVTSTRSHTLTGCVCLCGDLLQVHCDSRAVVFFTASKEMATAEYFTSFHFAALVARVSVLSGTTWLSHIFSFWERCCPQPPGDSSMGAFAVTSTTSQNKCVLFLFTLVLLLYLFFFRLLICYLFFLFLSDLLPDSLFPSSSSRSPPPLLSYPLLLVRLFFLLLSSFKLYARILTLPCLPSVIPHISLLYFKTKPYFSHRYTCFSFFSRRSLFFPLPRLFLFPSVALCTLGNHPLPPTIPSTSLTPASFHLFLPPSSLLPPSVSTFPLLRLCPSSSEPPPSYYPPGYSKEENG